MSDIKSPEERSKNMARIRDRDTKPEMWLRKELFRHGYRYRKNTDTIPGHPDIWMAKYNVAVFVNGCFWHRHRGCKYAYTPKSNVEFWETKFQKNIERDTTVQEQLRNLGIRIVTVWECSVKKAMKSESEASLLLERFQSFLVSDETELEL